MFTYFTYESLRYLKIIYSFNRLKTGIEPRNAYLKKVYFLWNFDDYALLNFGILFLCFVFLTFNVSSSSVPCFVVWSCVNSVHWANGSTQALPFSTVILLMLVWFLIGFPLTIVGGIMGKNTSADFDAPCRTKNIVREIPRQPWYRNMLCHMVFGGFLPFRLVKFSVRSFKVYSS